MTTGLRRPAEQGRGRVVGVRARERDPPARRALEPRDLRDHGPARDRPGGQPAGPGQALGAARVRRTRSRRSGSSSTRTTSIARSRGSRSSPTARSSSRTRTSRRSSPRSSGPPTRTCSCSRRSRWAAGPQLSPTASVRLRRGEEMVEESAMGDGLIDAAMGAIQRASGVEGRLVIVQRLGGHRRDRRLRRRRRAARRARPPGHGPGRRDRRRRGERARVPRRGQPRDADGEPEAEAAAAEAEKVTP